MHLFCCARILWLLMLQFCKGRDIKDGTEGKAPCLSTCLCLFHDFCKSTCTFTKSVGATREYARIFMRHYLKHTTHSFLFSSHSLHMCNQLPHSLQCHSSLQIFKTAVNHHLRSSQIQNYDILCQKFFFPLSP